MHDAVFKPSVEAKCTKANLFIHTLIQTHTQETQLLISKQGPASLPQLKSN